MKSLSIINPFNAPVFFEEIVSSTMDVSHQLASESAAHGTVITADFQKAGRGRIRNRCWEMEKGVNLPFTILLRYSCIEDIPAALTLRAGLSVSLAIEDFKPSLRNLVFVKWPNDIMIGSKKAAGILCEADGGYVHLGIGINVAQKEFPEHLRDRAASIALAGNGEQVTKNKEYLIEDEKQIADNNGRFALLEKILSRLYEELEIPAAESWKPRLERRLYKRGGNIEFTEGAADSGKIVRGCLTGIGESGELLILPDGEKEARSFFTGEIKFF